MELSKFLKDLLIVVVLFKTKPRESVAYKSLLIALDGFPAIPEILIYDNSPTPSTLSQTAGTYIHDPTNPGVSRAYNRASVHARMLDKKWMLFLDQDTEVTAIFFHRMECAVTEHPHGAAMVARIEDENGLLSPFRFARGRGQRTPIKGKILPLNKYRFINSGLLINRFAFELAGGYDERIPLDFSDVAFGSRLAKIYSDFIVLNASLRHAFSNNQRVPVEDALRRFQLFCTGAFVMGEIYGDMYHSYLNVLLRASRLSIRYRDHRFFTRGLQRALYD